MLASGCGKEGGGEKAEKRQVCMRLSRGAARWQCQAREVGGQPRKVIESNEWIAESSRNQLLSLSFIMRKYYCNGRDGADAKLEWLVAHESRNGKKKNFID